MSSVNNFIDKLNKLKSEEIVSVKLPSSQKEIKLNPLSVKQQKNLLRLTMDGPAGVANTLKEINNIIFDNVIDKDVDISSIDKYAILLELRKKSLGSSITIDDKKYNLNDIAKPEKPSPGVFSATVKYSNIEVKLELPDLSKENKFLSKVAHEIKKVKEDQGKETITTMYLYEVIKVIKTISFDGTEISFSELTNDECKQIVENFPVSLNQKILNYVKVTKDYENSIITFSDGAVVPIHTLFLTGE